MEPFLVVSLIAGMAGVGLGAFKLERHQRAKRADAWQAAARLAGGRFEPGGGSLFRPVPAKIVARLRGDLQVWVDHYTVSTGKSSSTFTRIVAWAPGAKIEIKLRKQGVVASLGTALGLGDLELGDAGFDARYAVRTSDDEMARAWLGSEVRATIMKAGADYELTLKDGKVTAQRLGIELEPERLTAAMHAVAALARGGRELVDRWRQLASWLPGTFTGADETFVPGRVRIQAESAGRQLSVELTADPARGTCVRRELGVRDARPFELSSGQPLDSLGAAAGVFADAGGEAAWQAIQPARLVGDGESVVVSWSGWVPDATRVRQAFALLTSIRAEPPRPYR